MKTLKLLLFGMIVLAFWACGGGEESSETEESRPEASTENPEASGPENRTEKRLICAANEDELTKLYLNLEFEGDIIRGVADYVTPKAGFTVYSYYNVKGSRNGNKLDLQLTLTESDHLKDIGKSHNEVWILDVASGTITPDFESVVPPLQIQDCSDEPVLYREAKEVDLSAKSYDYEGSIDAKLPIKMHLDLEPSTENPTVLMANGYYYYESQGSDKKITLSGSLVDENSPMPGFLIEMADGKEYGRFVVDPGTDVSQGFSCTFVSADGEKELEVELKRIDNK
ncbi:MAG: hypothetical protein AAFU64_19580 [Bacteroidota bacterium]